MYRAPTNRSQLKLEFVLFHGVYGEVAGAGGERHVGERRIDASGGDHAAAVGDEKILHVMRLIVFVQDAGFGIAAHAGGSHFVNAESGTGNILEGVDVAAAGGGQHFAGLGGDIARHGMFVVAPIAVNFQGRNSPRVELVLVHFDPVGVIRQTFAEAA